MLAGTSVASIIIITVLLVALYKMYYNRSWGWKFVWLLVAAWMVSSLMQVRKMQTPAPM